MCVLACLICTALEVNFGLGNRYRAVANFSKNEQAALFWKSLLQHDIFTRAEVDAVLEFIHLSVFLYLWQHVAVAFLPSCCDSYQMVLGDFWCRLILPCIKYFLNLSMHVELAVDLSSLLHNALHRESKKTCHQTFVYIFTKYWPISKILSLAHSVVNLQ